MYDRPEASSVSSLVQAIERQIERNELGRAHAACQQLLMLHSSCPEGWYLASRLAAKSGRSADALTHIDRALSLKPGFAPWMLRKAQYLQAAGMTAESLGISTTLQPRELPAAHLCVELGNLLTLQQEHAGALHAYEQALRLEPRRGDLHFNKAVVQRYMGDFARAEESCDAAIRLDPCDYEAQLLRSRLRKQTAERNHLVELKQMLERDALTYPGRTQVHYALAKECEDLGDFEQAFAHVQLGADLRRRHMSYDVGSDEEAMSRIAARYDSTLMREASAGFESPEPIFIIGLPRTGTSLVERVLAGHSTVFAAGELGNFAQQMTRLIKETAADSAKSKLAAIDGSTRLDFRRLGRTYVESVRPLTAGAARFTDKLPLNFLYAGLIALALPKAKLIHVTREPLDACYSIYKHHFKDAYPYSYDLQDLGRYFIAYRKLMDHWNAVMPNRIYQVAYEDLVHDFERQCRRLLEHCELSWQDSCLRFHENQAPSTTASAEQVRRPIYSEAVGRWRRVATQLQPLEVLLRSAGLL
jgi:tetratricopeptide (TPR) repeat protein